MPKTINRKEVKTGQRHTDISIPDRTEDILKKYEEKYRYLFEESPAAALVIGLDGTLTEVNKALLRSTGYQKEEVLGTKALDFVVPQQKSSVAELLQQALKGEWTPEQEVDFIAKDGSIHTLLFSPGNAYIYDKEVPVAIVLTGFDITERKYEEERYRHAVKMEALGRLAGSMAHDFNNLLMVIHNYTKILMKGHGDETPANEMLQEILDATRRAEKLTSKLLLFGRKKTVKEETLNINKLLHGMKKKLNGSVGEKVALKILPGDNLWNIKADPRLIEEVVLNLVINSYDAMPEGGDIIIATTNVEAKKSSSECFDLAPGNYVNLRVTDNGMGMDEKTKQCIFDPFFTTKEMETSKGLGLPVVYGAVKQCNGCIDIESKIEKGTTVKIYFPAVE